MLTLDILPIRQIGSRGEGGVLGLGGMILLAVDPGLTTGVAVFKDGRLVNSFTSKPPHTKLRDALASLEEQDEVACEKGPTNHRRQAETCAPVEALVNESALTTHWVRPSTWKPDPSAELLPGEKPGTKHERDAIRMGRSFLARRSSGD